MNNEENKNQDLTYDFNFEDQVVKNDQNIKDNEVEVLNDVETEELEELEEIGEINNTTSKLDESQEELLEETETTTNNEEKETKDNTNNKKIKILNKEFNFEDIILVIIGLVIVASIFLLPRIMNIFN